MGDDSVGDEVYMQCSNGINELWFILIVPITALSWSGSFTPQYQDLPLMCFHGCLGYAVNYGLSRTHTSGNLNNFVSALVISTSAGLVSRFTGRSAVAYTVAGYVRNARNGGFELRHFCCSCFAESSILRCTNSPSQLLFHAFPASSRLYVLLPGAYLVSSLFSTTLDGRFFNDIIQRAIIIGLGAWSGTLLCSPTLLGTTSGILNQQSERRSSSRHLHDSTVVKNEAMLFF